MIVHPFKVLNINVQEQLITFLKPASIQLGNRYYEKFTHPYYR